MTLVTEFLYLLGILTGVKKFLCVRLFTASSSAVMHSSICNDIFCQNGISLIFFTLIFLILLSAVFKVDILFTVNSTHFILYYCDSINIILQNAAVYFKAVYCCLLVKNVFRFFFCITKVLIKKICMIGNKFK